MVRTVNAHRHRHTRESGYPQGAGVLHTSTLSSYVGSLASHIRTDAVLGDYDFLAAMAECQQVRYEREAVFAIVESITLAGIVAPPYAGVSAGHVGASALPGFAGHTLDALYASSQRRFLELLDDCGQVGFIGSQNVLGQLPQLLFQDGPLLPRKVGRHGQTPISLSTSPMALSSPATI